MKAMQIKKYGQVSDVFKMEEIPVPEVSEDEVLVEVFAISVNPFDYKTIEGAPEIKSLVKHHFPFTVGIDLSGVVAKIGAGVKRFKPGDEVFAKMPETSGAFAEFVAVKESWLAAKPKSVTHEEAAAIPLVGLTTWQSLIDTAHLAKGQKVFIQAGAGGIGTFAIQLAKSVGATVATTTSKQNMELVKNLGADVVIDYKSQKFRDVLKDYDVVYDTLGGKALEDSLYVPKRGGIAVTIVGPPDAEWAQARGMNFVVRFFLSILGAKVRGLSKKLGIRYKFVMAASRGDELAQIARLIDEKKIRPVIDNVFPFDQTKEAMIYLQQGRAKGKVVAKVK